MTSPLGIYVSRAFPSYISLKNVSKIFKTKGGAVEALRDVNIDIGENEFVSIVGPSGCGKTTILKIIAGLIQPTTGEVYVRGEKVVNPIRNVGMVFQSPVLLRWRTVLKNIILPIEIKKLNEKYYLEKARYLIELTGLKGFEDKYPYELSGGMQQRVSICRALITDPDVLLMDEPFGALDALTRDQLNRELINIWQHQRKTVVFVTHSVNEAVYLSDKIYVMSPRPGTIIEEVKVDIPRPRNRGDPKFVTLAERILKLLGVEFDA